MMDQRIGLALGGGGARGLAHLGVLIALEELDLPVSLITGTSMGAAMGATRAIGADLRKIERMLGCLDLNEILQVSDSTVRELQKIIGRSMVEYVRGSAWREGEAAPHDLVRLNELFSLLTARKTFDETVIPFAAVAADLESGERVVLNRGTLFRALTASTAVPGVFSPVSYNERFLIDGGIVDKLPIDVAIDMGASSVIAVDTGAPMTREIATCLDAVIQTQRVTSYQLTQLQIEVARRRLEDRLVVLRPDVGWIRMFDFCHTAEAIQAGKESVQAHLEEIRDITGIPVTE